MSSRKNITLVVVGDTESKKTDLLLKYTTDKKLYGNFKPSIFVNNIQNVIVDRIQYSVNFVNAESDDVYKSLRLTEYKQANCFILCYSISNRTTFENITKKWCVEMRKCCSYIPIILVGNSNFDYHLMSLRRFWRILCVYNFGNFHNYLFAITSNFDPPLVMRGCFLVPNNEAYCPHIESVGPFVNCNACNKSLCNRM
ncbi:hypothetical protein RN001_009562 [Aquatica leii]|uniref:Uncharacterized protein n=1 Tax=Aquatica leii TaxID=1421715 RepID=A0AAN7P8X5_9COLE|nr:hypothetical protein RN001_009562 [Aquatica leii]